MILNYLVHKYNNSRERESFSNNTDDGFAIIIGNIIGIFISFYAAYLSFQCNDPNSSIATNLLWAFFAFGFGIVYLIYYFFVNYLTGTCDKLKKT